MMKKILFTFSFCILINSFAFAQNRYSTWDVFKYSGPGLKQIGWLDTRHSSEIKSSSWSVGCETLDRDYAKFSAYKDYVGELGVKRARIQSGWAKTEKEKGIYSFAWLDSVVYGLAEMGVKPWMCLCYGNPLYGSNIRLGSNIFTDEKSMVAWCKYVEATVSRYKDVVSEWEVWNEPHPGASKEYANLLMRTAETIKKVHPEAKVMGFSLAGGLPLKFTQEVFEILKANDRLGFIDYLTYHPYSRNPDDRYTDIEKLRALAHSYNPEIKLFQGEVGCPSILEFGHALNYYPWTEISQAKWNMRLMAGHRVRDIPSSVFTIIDLKYTNMLQSFGLIRSNLLNEFIYKRPSYYGVQHMVSFFDDTVQPIGELEYSSNAYRKMTVAGFQKDNTPVVLVWYNDRIPDDDLKWDLVNLTIRGRNYKDPVYVEMISGKVFEIDKPDWENKGEDVVFKKLPVWDSVMMIAERSKVEFGEKPE
jgi:polysaccharide biosynthesis protein PslG